MQTMKLAPGHAAAPERWTVPAPPRLPALKEATQEFEAQFVAMLVQSMRRTVPEGPLAGRGERLFREMLDQEWAAGAAASGGLGIAEMLYDQLSKAVQGATCNAKAWASDHA
jgi:flagellar protein FlgJ